jgi:hypothetical protein
MQEQQLMAKKENFVDELMNRAFDLPAPEMPDFKCGNQDDSIEELDFEQLDYLAAAGQTEILISKKLAEKP